MIQVHQVEPLKTIVFRHLGPTGAPESMMKKSRFSTAKQFVDFGWFFILPTSLTLSSADDVYFLTAIIAVHVN